MSVQSSEFPTPWHTERALVLCPGVNQGRGRIEDLESIKVMLINRRTLQAFCARGTRTRQLDLPEGVREIRERRPAAAFRIIRSLLEIGVNVNLHCLQNLVANAQRAAFLIKGDNGIVLCAYLLRRGVRMSLVFGAE